MQTREPPRQLRYITDADLRTLKRLPSRTIAPSPTSFNGTIEELYERHILQTLPLPETVQYYHDLLSRYCRAGRPLYLLRQVPRVERRIVYRSPAGFFYTWTDNSPAWFFHYVLYNDLLIEPTSFAALIAATPSHFHDVGKLLPASINSAGWYVAHIYRVNNGDTRFTEWGEAELTRRFIRNVHPCNHFYVPKSEGTRLGEAEHVIAQFAHWNAQRYAAVWPEFLALAQAEALPYDEGTRSIDCSFGPKVISAIPPSYVPPAATARHELTAVPEPKVTYTYYRFGFKAKEIEPLQADDLFRMETPVGIFQMTKAQFYATFPGVITSKSYRVRGEYHWPKPPSIALQFRIDV